MNKLDATKYVIDQAARESMTTSSVKKMYRAMRCLGLNVAESLDAMQHYGAHIDYLREIPDFAALPEIGSK